MVTARHALKAATASSSRAVPLSRSPSFASALPDSSASSPIGAARVRASIPPAPPGRPRPPPRAAPSRSPAPERVAEIYLRHRPVERHAFARPFLQSRAVGRDRLLEPRRPALPPPERLERSAEIVLRPRPLERHAFARPIPPAPPGRPRPPPRAAPSRSPAPRASRARCRDSPASSPSRAARVRASIPPAPRGKPRPPPRAAPSRSPAPRAFGARCRDSPAFPPIGAARVRASIPPAPRGRPAGERQVRLAADRRRRSAIDGGATGSVAGGHRLAPHGRAAADGAPADRLSSASCHKNQAIPRDCGDSAGRGVVIGSACR